MEQKAYIIGEETVRKYLTAEDVIDITEKTWRWYGEGKVVINQELCVGCGICKNRCPQEVISIKQTMPMRKDLHEYFAKDYNLDLKIWKNTENPTP